MNKKAVIYLFILSALWGLTFPVIGDSVKTIDPLMFVAMRFSLAALFVIVYFLKNLTREALRVSLILGIIQAIVFITQTVGLETVNASRAAFLAGINVLVVPFMAPLLHMGRLRRHDSISAVICFFGIFVLTECSVGHLTLGDIWIILSALLIGYSIVYIGKVAKSSIDPLMLAYGQIVICALFSWVPVLFFSEFDLAPFGSNEAIVSLIVCSIFATVVAITLQAKYQKFVPLQFAALIYSLEPVFAAIFDFILHGVIPTSYTVVGGAIILFSIIYLELFRPRDTLASN